MAQRLLLIEDDAALASMLADYLAPHGFELRVAHRVDAGLQALAKGGFDALLLDVMLPDGDGLEVCRRVRAGSDLPILMLTARGDDADRIVGLELGADDYLPKPFNPRELLARLRAVLRRQRGGAGRGQRLHFGRLEIDPDARQVRLDGAERPLTSRQFELLLAMAERPGRVLSREALMDCVGAGPLEAFDRSIDVHVSRIRAAIEEDPRRPRRIVTVRGAGYVFARDPDAS